MVVVVACAGRVVAEVAKDAVRAGADQAAVDSYASPLAGRA